MHTSESSVTARCAVAGLHHWPTAPERRAYLRQLHRHVFEVKAIVRTTHHEREVEFHDLGELLERELRALGSSYHPDADLLTFGAQSCETLAAKLLSALRRQGYDALGVTVSEDGEHDGSAIHIALEDDEEDQG